MRGQSRSTPKVGTTGGELASSPTVAGIARFISASSSAVCFPVSRQLMEPWASRCESRTRRRINRGHRRLWNRNPRQHHRPQKRLLDENQRLAGNAAIATFNNSWMTISNDTPLLFATLCEGNTIKNSAVGFDLNESFSLPSVAPGYENCPEGHQRWRARHRNLPGNPEALKSPK